MANDALSRTGFFPYRKHVRINVYVANTGLNLFRWQPVVVNNTGQVETADIADNSEILGSVYGFLDTTLSGLPTNLTDLTQNSFLDSLNNARALVLDDPEQLYIMEEDTGGTALTASAVGNNVNFIYTATTGNTTTGVSNALIDRSAVVTSGTGGQLRIVRLAEDIVNTDGTTNGAGDYGKWVVKINKYPYGATFRGVAI